MIPKIIVIHHTASSRDWTTVADIDAWHKLRWPEMRSELGYYVGYHWVITADGTATQTRKETEIGAHCVPNNGRIGICLTGNFETEVPTREQLTSLNSLLIKTKIGYNIPDNQIFGHKELDLTLCPGKNLMKWITLTLKISVLQKLLKALQQLLASKGR